MASSSNFRALINSYATLASVSNISFNVYREGMIKMHFHLIRNSKEKKAIFRPSASHYLSSQNPCQRGTPITQYQQPPCPALQPRPPSLHHRNTSHPSPSRPPSP